MQANDILFDDWETRYDEALRSRKKAYIFFLSYACITCLFSLVGSFFKWPLIMPFFIFLLVLISIILEWLKIKNNHLVIKNNQIEITNRFNKTRIYEINAKELVIMLRHSIFNRRSGGIVIKFYDSKKNFICKYEDMLNGAIPFGVKKTNWEKSIEALGVKIIDTERILRINRNRPY